MNQNVAGNWQLLQNAVKHCLHGSLRRLVGEGQADVDGSDHIGHTALHKAVIKGCLICCQTLIELGADVNRRDVFGQTPLFMGSLNNISGPLVKQLLASGADPYIVNREKRQLVYELVDNDNAKAMEELLGFSSTEFLPQSVLGSSLCTYIVTRRKHATLCVYLQHLNSLNIQEDAYEYILAVGCWQKDLIAIESVLTMTGVHIQNTSTEQMRKPLFKTVPAWVATNLGLRYSKLIMQATCDVTQLTPFVYSKDNYPLEDYSQLLNFLHCLGYTFTQEDKEYILEVSERLHNELRESLKHAPPLMALCRNNIRSCLRTNALHAVPDLPLPVTIKAYLVLLDFIIGIDS